MKTKDYNCTWCIFDISNKESALICAHKGDGSGEEAMQKCAKVFGFKDLDDLFEHTPGKCYNDSYQFMTDVYARAEDKAYVAKRQRELPVKQYRDHALFADYFGCYETYKLDDIIPYCMHYLTINEYKDIHGDISDKPNSWLWFWWCIDWRG